MHDQKDQRRPDDNANGKLSPGQAQHANEDSMPGDTQDGSNMGSWGVEPTTAYGGYYGLPCLAISDAQVVEPSISRSRCPRPATNR